MHRLWIARVMLVACLGWLVLPLELVAQTEPSTAAIDGQEKKVLGIQRDIAVFKEATRQRLEAQKERVQKDLHDLQSRIGQQESRITDMHAATGRLGLFLSVFAGHIMLLVAVTGLATWYRAGTKARETAQEWISRHESERRAEAINKKNAAAMSVSQSIQSSLD